MKALKITIVAVLIVVAVIGGVVFYGLYNIDSIIKDAVEKYGSEAAGVKVSLNEVNVELKKGRIELLGLDVANPPGYTKPSLFSLGKIVLQVKPESLSGDPIIIDEITIDQPAFVVEEKNLTTTNLSEVAANLKKLQASSGAANKEPEAQTRTGDEPLIAVTQLNFSLASLTLTSERFGDRTIDMPSFSAKNVGGVAGLPPDQLAAALLGEVVKQSSESVKRGFHEAVGNELKGRAQELLDKNVSDEDKSRINAVKSLLGR